MNLIKDYVHAYNPQWDIPGQCHIRVYRGTNEATVFICSELPDNSNGTIELVVEALATDIWKQEGEPEPFVWIEHYPAEVSPTHLETFDEVTFIRHPNTRFFTPKWRPLTKQEVEELIGTTLT